MASEAPLTVGMTEAMTATIAYVAGHSTAAMKRDPKAKYEYWHVRGEFRALSDGR
jgi:hypothetical protein